jgi:hypothetical protein
MSDFLTRITAEANKPIGREVTILGETSTVWFRLMTAAQRHSLLAGHTYQVKKGESPTVTVDLGENETERQKLVFFCVASEDGKPFFRNLEAVKALPAPVVDALADAAKAVNREVFGEAENASAGES